MLGLPIKGKDHQVRNIKKLVFIILPWKHNLYSIEENDKKKRLRNFKKLMKDLWQIFVIPYMYKADPFLRSTAANKSLLEACPNKIQLDALKNSFLKITPNLPFYCSPAIILRSDLILIFRQRWALRLKVTF